VFGVEFGVIGEFDTFELLPKKFDIQDICRRVVYSLLTLNCSGTPFLSGNGRAVEVYNVLRHVEHSVLDVIFGAAVFAKVGADLHFSEVPRVTHNPESMFHFVS
jgi:hypothetical protein